MDNSRFARIEALFNAALDLPPDARSDFLAAECADDHELRADVERLLATDEAGDESRLSAVVDDAARELTETQPRAVGPYRLVRVIGRGGMGAVWLAERADDVYRGQVAIKLVRGFAHPELERRFRAERQILADLRHPNIARLLDGGAAPDGTPYLVMEYVDGEPVTTYAARNALDLQRRLRIFLDICDAVQHAHASLIVHRDIKPSNILVGGDGAPRLLDFGIAKLISPDADGDTTVAMRLMTPAYASPEQVRGERVTVATDVYSLGVLLYELLTGSAPFGHAGNELETQQRILNEEPRAPGEALRASDRAGSWPITTRELRGDIDNIVLRALEKEPQRRYRTVAELASDVSAFLEGQPVRARPATAGYRLRKFVRRNRVPVAAAAVVLLALSGGMGATAWQAEVADRARGEAVTARGDAESAATRASEVTEFLVSIFAASDPSQNAGVEPTVRDLLARGIARVDSLQDPMLRGELLMTLGRVQRWRGDFRSSADLYGRAVDVWESIEGEPDTLIVTSVNIHAIALNLAGFPDSAAAGWQRALELGERLLGEEHPITVAVIGNLAVAMTRLGRMEEGEALYLRQIELENRILPPDDLDRTYTLNNLGVHFANIGRFTEAEPLLREAHRIREARMDETDATLAFPNENLGMMLREAGRYEEAEPYLNRGLELRRKLLGEQHRWVAESLYSTGLLYALWGRPGDHVRADSLLRGSLALYDATTGPDHPGKAYTFHALGQLEMQRNDPAEAERWFREALRLRQQPRDAPRVAVQTRIALAHAIREQGRAAEARRLMDEAWRVADELLMDGEPVHSAAYIGMGLVLADAHDTTASSFYVAGISALADRIGATHPVVAEACARGRAAGLSSDVCND